MMAAWPHLAPRAAGFHEALRRRDGKVVDAIVKAAQRIQGSGRRRHRTERKRIYPAELGHV
jgi:hypothetical protein